MENAFKAIQGVILVAVFLLPGYLSELVANLLGKTIFRKPGEPVILIILNYLMLSAFNLGLLFYPFYSLRLLDILRTDVYRFVVFAIPSILVSSLIVGFLLSKLNARQFRRWFFRRFHRVLPAPDSGPRAWDWIFSTTKPCIAVITLKDDKKVAGLFGENSFASSYPFDEEIYLEKTFPRKSDGTLEMPSEENESILMRGEHIKWIEFFTPKSKS